MGDVGECLRRPPLSPILGPDPSVVSPGQLEIFRSRQEQASPRVVAGDGRLRRVPLPGIMSYACVILGHSRGSGLGVEGRGSSGT